MPGTAKGAIYDDFRCVFEKQLGDLGLENRYVLEGFSHYACGALCALSSFPPPLAWSDNTPKSVPTGMVFSLKLSEGDFGGEGFESVWLVEEMKGAGKFLRVDFPVGSQFYMGT